MKPLKRFATIAAVTASVPVVAVYIVFGHTLAGAVTTDLAPPQVAAPQPPAHHAPATGWIRPVDAPVWGGFRTKERPDHLGVDIGASRGTPIRAAASGTVVRVRCNVVPESHGCDQDGSPYIGGCGWYVDLRHAGDIYTRYCHMLHQPPVTVGQTVAAGDVIGTVGSSGNSSAPHLHFEVRIGSEDNTSAAVDPVAFMADQGVPLGTG